MRCPPSLPPRASPPSPTPEAFTATGGSPALRWKIGPAHQTDCARAEGYGAMEAIVAIDLGSRPLPETEGAHRLCFLGQRRARRAGDVPVHLYRPDAAEPSPFRSVNEDGAERIMELLHVPPELVAFELARGPASALACDASISPCRWAGRPHPNAALPVATSWARWARLAAMKRDREEGRRARHLAVNLSFARWLRRADGQDAHFILDIRGPGARRDAAFFQYLLESPSLPVVTGC